LSTLVFLLEDEGKDEEAEPWKLHLQTHAATAQPLGELDSDIPEERTQYSDATWSSRFEH